MICHIKVTKMLDDFLNNNLGVYIGRRYVNDPLMQELINYLNKEHIPINGLNNASIDTDRYKSYKEFFRDSYAWEILLYDPRYGVDMIRGRSAVNFESVKNVVSIEKFIGSKEETIKEISYEENELMKLFE